MNKFQTIAQVDTAVRDMALHGLPEAILSKLTLFELPFVADSLPLRQLMAMRYICRQSEDVARIYREHDAMNRAALQFEDVSPRHFQGYQHAFQQINAMSDNAFGGDRVRRFLDLGCAPGAFAAWILQNNAAAGGIGITLSPDAGGIRPQIDPTFSERFDVRFEDVLKIATGQAVLGGTLAGGFDLVIAHAATVLAGERIPWTQIIGLTYAQLLVAFEHIAGGGSLVISLRSHPFNWVADIVWMLTQAFTSVHAVHTAWQAKRPFAYVVCQGFRVGVDQRSMYVVRLRECLIYLENTSAPIDDPFGGAVNIPCLSAAQQEDIPDDVRHCVLSLFTSIWQSKFNALHSHYQKVLENYVQDAEEAAGLGTSQPINVIGVCSNEGGPFSWKSRPITLPDSYQRRREQRNAGINALFNCKDGVSSRADRAVSWRRCQPEV